jgi:uncharacterized protein YidB (DUF937 family)
MLESLIQLVKDNAGEAIINNPAVPNEQNDAAIEATAGSIFDSLKSQFAGSGGMDMITNLFQGNEAASTNPVSGNVANDAISGLVKKIGLPEGAAAGIVSQLLPKVMDSLKSKTNDPNDNSFDLQGIIGSLTGGDAGGIINKVKGMFGM